MAIALTDTQKGVIASAIVAEFEAKKKAGNQLWLADLVTMDEQARIDLIKGWISVQRAALVNQRNGLEQQKAESELRFDEGIVILDDLMRKVDTATKLSTASEA